MFQDISNKKNSNPTKLQRNDIDLFSILYDIKKMKANVTSHSANFSPKIKYL